MTIQDFRFNSEIHIDNVCVVIDKKERQKYSVQGGGCVAMNYDFKEFGLNFKACCFANIYYNKQLDAIKTFLIDIINEKLKEMRQ